MQVVRSSVAIQKGQSLEGKLTNEARECQSLEGQLIEPEHANLPDQISGQTAKK